jgi:hypothetical protein
LTGKTDTGDWYLVQKSYEEYVRLESWKWEEQKILRCYTIIVLPILFGENAKISLSERFYSDLSVWCSLGLVAYLGLVATPRVPD